MLEQEHEESHVTYSPVFVLLRPLRTSIWALLGWCSGRTCSAGIDKGIAFTGNVWDAFVSDGHLLDGDTVWFAWWIVVNRTTTDLVAFVLQLVWHVLVVVGGAVGTALCRYFSVGAELRHLGGG